MRGRATVEDPSEREELLLALDQGIAAGGPVMMCFEPRHALRATTGGRVAEAVICFQCGQVAVTIDDHWEYHPIGASVEDVFDRALARHGLTKAP